MLDQIGEDVKSAAREIYYARMHLRGLPNFGHVEWAMASLDLALNKLGVHGPKDVGLSATSLGEKK